MIHCPQDQYTQSKRGLLIPATVVGTAMWVKFSQLCEQRDRMEERGINPVI